MKRHVNKRYLAPLLVILIISCSSNIGVPSLIHPTGGEQVSVPLILVWSSVSNAQGYKIEIETTLSFGSPIFSADTFDTSSTINDLDILMYYWRVAAVDEENNHGEFSDIDSFEVANSLNPVNWQTNRVSLRADNFFLIADGDTFYANVPNVDLSSDQGDSTYCSLEVTWQEKGTGMSDSVEMRLFFYFSADGTNWWSDEFRTYDGQLSPEWIYYYGTFFTSPIGTTYTGNFEQESDTSNIYPGKVHFDGLMLRAFLNQ